MLTLGRACWLHSRRHARALALLWLGSASALGCDLSAASAATASASLPAPEGEPMGAPDAVRAGVPVHLAPVERGVVDRPVYAFGKLFARHQLPLSFKVGGVVASVLVEKGARVKRGQLLATLETTELSAQHMQAHHLLAKAQRDRARVETLRSTGAVGSVAAQDTATAFQLAQAAAGAATYNFKQTRLIAPDDGLVDANLVRPGQVVAPGQPVFHLESSEGGPIARIEVTDRDALALQIGASAGVQIDADPGKQYRAHVSEVAQVATEHAGTYAVELAFDGHAPAHLPLGLTLKAQIARVGTVSVRVPVSALVEGAGRTAAVYVCDANRARRVPVIVDTFQGDEALLASDLERVEAVVDRGAQLLYNGAPLRPLP